jgi:hypothetical protein
MGSIAILLLLIMLARSQGGRELPTVPRPRDLPYSPEPFPPPSAKRQAPSPVPASAPPWPQVMPEGLPPFGPAGWEPDQPPPIQVQSRAVALLSPLWRGGAGTRKTEQTAGRWITYVATPMGKKKGVVAYRLRAPSPPPTDAAAPALLTST